VKLIPDFSPARALDETLDSRAARADVSPGRILRRDYCFIENPRVYSSVSTRHDGAPAETIRYPKRCETTERVTVVNNLSIDVDLKASEGAEEESSCRSVDPRSARARKSLARDTEATAP